MRLNSEIIISSSAQLREIAYGTKTYVFKADDPGEEESEDLNESLDLERGENLLELQVVGASLSADALETQGDSAPSTFCTYSFYLFEQHATPVVTGLKPTYGFTSRYVVSLDDRFLNYLNRSSLSVELHQALGLDWITLGSGQIRLQTLLEQDGRVYGTVPLTGEQGTLFVSRREERSVCQGSVYLCVSVSGTCGSRSLGSLDFSLRLRIPMTETMYHHRERLKAVDFLSSTLDQDTQVPDRLT